MRRILLTATRDPIACSLDGKPKLTLSYWSREGELAHYLNWSFGKVAVESPQFVQQDRYLVFKAHPETSEFDPHLEPMTLGVDMLYPSFRDFVAVPGGRTVQKIAETSAQVQSIERSTAFAAAFLVGRELRFWETHSPPLLQQHSIPVTNTIRSFAVWNTPPVTSFTPNDRAVVAAANDKGLDIFAERYEKGNTQASIQLVSRHLFDRADEIGRTFCSQDGAYVGVAQWTGYKETYKHRIVLYRRAERPESEALSIPSSAELAKTLGLENSELEALYRR